MHMCVRVYRGLLWLSSFYLKTGFLLATVLAFLELFVDQNGLEFIH